VAWKSHKAVPAVGEGTRLFMRLYTGIVQPGNGGYTLYAIGKSAVEFGPKQY
jgi:hypothetical protein